MSQSAMLLLYLKEPIETKIEPAYLDNSPVLIKPHHPGVPLWIRHPYHLQFFISHPYPPPQSCHSFDPGILTVLTHGIRFQFHKRPVLIPPPADYVDHLE